MTDWFEFFQIASRWWSFSAGLCLLFFGFLVMMAYLPRSWLDRSASGQLAVAIFLGFAAAVLNTIYWQLFAHPARYYELIDRVVISMTGNWLDGLFKGGAAFAGYVHLRALHRNLSEEDRRKWGVLEMAFYPNRVVCLNLLTRAIRRRTKK